MASKTYTLAQVQGHNTESDCWIIIHNKIYDVTVFQSSHPGGGEPILDFAGRCSKFLFCPFF
jgi:cytochrome b involved in lipid metabolism